MVGAPPYVCQRLLGLAVRNWVQFHGKLLRGGVRPLELPLPWLLDMIHSWAVDGAEEKDVVAFEARLYQPPEGETPAEDDAVWGDEALMGDFLQAANSLG